MRFTVGVFAFACTISQVAAHGFVPTVRVDGVEFIGWNVNLDAYAVPPPLRPVRRTPNDNGYVSDPTSPDITCSIGNSYLPSGGTIPVQAGGTVQIQWSTWPSSHSGPVMNYIAKCQGNCSTFKGDTGAIWSKISQKGFENGKWASDELIANGFKWDVPIPASLAPGDYLLRHENLALHEGEILGHAQFYPVCIQLTVSGDGTKVPGGLSFPGAYNATDPGILFNPYLGDTVNNGYVPPGGPVTDLTDKTCPQKTKRSTKRSRRRL